MPASFRCKRPNPTPRMVLAGVAALGLVLCAALALAGRTLYVAADGAPLRAQAKAGAEVLAWLPRGARLAALDESGEDGPWLAVRDATGREGFVYRGHADPSPPPPLPALLGEKQSLFEPPPASIILAEAADSARSTRSHGGPPKAGDCEPLWQVLDLRIPPEALDEFLREGGLGEHARVQPSGAAMEAALPVFRPAAPPGGENERQVGLNLAVRVLRGVARPAFGQSTQRYVNMVALAVARHSPQPLPGFRVLVLESASPLAFTLPGGLAMLSTGALQALDNEAQLALLLAHHAAHAALGHAWSIALAQPFFRAEAGAQAQAPVQVDKDSANSPLFDNLLETVEARVLRVGLNLAHEREADALALVMAARAGYDAQQWPALLARMDRAAQGVEPAGGALPWTRLHAPMGRRLAAVQHIQAQLPQDGLALNTERFRKSR